MTNSAHKAELFAVLWADNALGHLHLRKDTAEEAIALAVSIRAKGDGLVQHVRAVHVAEGTDAIIDIG